MPLRNVLNETGNTAKSDAGEIWTADGLYTLFITFVNATKYSFPGPRLSFAAAEKLCGKRWDSSGKIGASLKADSIRRECEASLRRLCVDVIDLYQIHWPEPDEDIEEGWTELARLQEEGKVRFIGVSNFSVAQIKRAQSIAPITSLQPPYSIVTSEIEREILPYAKRQNIGVIVYSPMSAGLLTGSMTLDRVANLSAEDWRRNLPNFKEPLLSRNLRLVEHLRDVGHRLGRTPGEVAIAWTLHNPAVTGTIVGFRTTKQVSGIAGAAEFRLTEAEMTEIAEVLKQEIAA